MKGKELKKELAFSIDNMDGSCSENANKHLRRVVRGQLEKLEIDFYTGKASIENAGLYEVFYVDAKHEDKIKELLKVFGKDTFMRIEEAGIYKEFTRIQIHQYSIGIKEVCLFMKIKADIKDNCAMWFYDGKAKQYWALVDKEKHKLTA